MLWKCNFPALLYVNSVNTASLVERSMEGWMLGNFVRLWTCYFHWKNQKEKGGWSKVLIPATSWLPLPAGWTKTAVLVPEGQDPLRYHLEQNCILCLGHIFIFDSVFASIDNRCGHQLPPTPSLSLTQGKNIFQMRPTSPCLSINLATKPNKRQNFL